MIGTGPLTDWTNGTGVFPTGGSITITPNTERQYVYVQNRDLGEVLVTFAAAYANGSGSGTVSISLNAAGTSGYGGGTEDMDVLQFVATGQIVISGTAGQKVTVLTA